MFKEGDLVITTDQVATSLWYKPGIITKVYTKNDRVRVQEIYRMKIFGLDQGDERQENCFDWVDVRYLRKLTKLDKALK